MQASREGVLAIAATCGEGVAKVRKTYTKVSYVSSRQQSDKIRKTVANITPSGARLELHYQTVLARPNREFACATNAG
jgi:hypothetical protein